jgi:hypothetical protein
MMDVFEDRPELDAPLARLLDRIARTPDLDFLLLTKRPENFRIRMTFAARAYEFAQAIAARWMAGDPPPNVWVGTSTEDQAAADSRIPALLAIPAAVRFISAEPLLGPITLPLYLATCPHCDKPTKVRVIGARPTREEPFSWYCARRTCGDQFPLAAVDWVIAGGETGAYARPCHPQWVRGLRDQAAKAGIPFLFKQWGSWFPITETKAPIVCTGHHNRVIGIDGQPGNATNGPYAILARTGRKTAGRELDGITHHAFPETRP